MTYKRHSESTAKLELTLRIWYSSLEIMISWYRESRLIATHTSRVPEQPGRYSPASYANIAALREKELIKNEREATLVHSSRGPQATGRPWGPQNSTNFSKQGVVLRRLKPHIWWEQPLYQLFGPRHPLTALGFVNSLNVCHHLES